MIIRTDAHKAHCLETIANLSPGKVWEVRIEPYVKRRSTDHNAYYHAAVVEPIVRHTGNDHDTVHEFLKAEFCPPRKIQVGDKEKYIKSTKLLSTPEMLSYCEQCQAWAIQELGVNFGDSQ